MWTRSSAPRHPLRPAEPGQPTIPFIGLSEALVLAAVQNSGVPLQASGPRLNCSLETSGPITRLGFAPLGYRRR